MHCESSDGSCNGEAASCILARDSCTISDTHRAKLADSSSRKQAEPDLDPLL